MQHNLSKPQNTIVVVSPREFVSRAFLVRVNFGPHAVMPTTVTETRPDRAPAGTFATI
jgi:hypothetical protein